MFTKSIVFPSIVSAVNQVMVEADNKKKLLLEPGKVSPEIAGGRLEKSKDDKRAASGHSSEVVESHSDEKEDKALVKKMVKKTALKPEPKETELDSHHKMTSEGSHTQNYMNIDHSAKNKKPEDTTYGRHRQNATDDSKEAYRPKTNWKRDPITAFTDKIHDTIADKFGKKKTNEESEPLDELSKKTLASYSDKAIKDADKHFTKGAKKWADCGNDHEKEDEEVDKEVDKGLNRFKGVNKARDRIHGFAKDKGVNRYRKYAAEEVESLEELDQKTLRSYVRKTRDDDSRSAGSAQANTKHAARLEKDKAEYAASGKEWPTLGGISRKLKAKEYPFQKEDVESLEELSKKTLGSYVKKASTEDGDTKSGREAGVTKAAHRTQGLSHKPGSVGGFKKYNAEDVELDERHLTPSETKTKEHNVKAMKKNTKGFKALYGDRAKSVMYATATKQAEHQKEEVESLDEAKSGYDLYHSQYSGAVHHGLAHHSSKEGLSVHDDDYHQHVSIGPRKPASGETVHHHIPAHNEKGEPHTIHMQIYNRGGDGTPYELNTYSSKHPKRQVKEADETKRTLKKFKSKQEDIGGVSTMSEKAGESQVRVDGETDMDTKTIDTLKGRKKVGADYHNKALSYKVGLTVGEDVQLEHKGPDTDSEPFIQNANTSSSPLGIAKGIAHKAFKKIQNETMLGKIETSKGKK